jgi:hypothetical protein
MVNGLIYEIINSGVMNGSVASTVRVALNCLLLFAVVKDVKVRQSATASQRARLCEDVFGGNEILFFTFSRAGFFILLNFKFQVHVLLVLCTVL